MPRLAAEARTCPYKHARKGARRPLYSSMMSIIALRLSGVAKA